MPFLFVFLSLLFRRFPKRINSSQAEDSLYNLHTGFIGSSGTSWMFHKSPTFPQGCVEIVRRVTKCNVLRPILSSGRSSSSVQFQASPIEPAHTKSLAICERIFGGVCKRAAADIHQARLATYLHCTPHIDKTAWLVSCPSLHTPMQATSLAPTSVPRGAFTFPQQS